MSLRIAYRGDTGLSGHGLFTKSLRSHPFVVRCVWGGRPSFAVCDRDGPASGENIRHLCRLRTLGYFGLDPPNRGPGLVGNKRIRVQTVRGVYGRGTHDGGALYRNVQWFRGGLVFKAHRLLYHSEGDARRWSGRCAGGSGRRLT